MKGGNFYSLCSRTKRFNYRKNKGSFLTLRSVSLYALDLRPLSLFRHTFLRAARLAQPARL